MDTRESERSQSRRPSIKRPWEEEVVLPEKGNAWLGGSLPPIDPSPHRRPSISTLPRHDDLGSSLHSIYHPDNRDLGAKRARYEGNDDYISTSKPPSRAPQIYNPSQRSLDSPNFQEAWTAGEPVQDTAILCQRCRRLTTQHQDLESCEESVTRAAAALTHLELKIWGLDSASRGVIPTTEQSEISSTECPLIAQYGLRHTLNWLLDRINHINGLADKFVQNVPSRSSPIIDRNLPGRGKHHEDGITGIMKRHIETDPDEAPRDSGDNAEPHSDSRQYTRRRSIATPMLGHEELSSRARHDYHHSPMSSGEGLGRRASIMNPPPAPNRQLPSPPGRSLPSPTSLSFSPSGPSYGMAQAPNLPSPAGLRQSPPGAYLPSIGATHASDAIQAHSAALQHEVSVQKIALSSLQGEHDKLLAAFSRSQTRAAALEKKHAVSDSEIVSLSEEKMRLQTQVIELERDVEELSRTRDDFRQAAVQEGAQYVEIVKKASQLEEIAAEERKTWAKIKAELEQTIESLRAGTRVSDATFGTPPILPVPRILDDVDTPTSSVEAQSDFKIELIPDLGPTSFPRESHRDSNEALKEEIRVLRSRCAEVESALRAVRDDSRNMEGIVEALSLAGKSIIERADRALGNMAED